MKLALGFLAAVSFLMASCATRNPGTVVTVTRSRDTVRECAFLGGVTSTDASEEGDRAGSLQKQTADRGGNVLFLIGSGLGEAYRCHGSLIVTDSSNPRPTRHPLVPAPTPTPARP